MLAVFVAFTMLLGSAQAVVDTSDVDTPAASTCGDLRAVFKKAECCGYPSNSAGYQVVPMPDTTSHILGDNPCAGAKPTVATVDGVTYNFTNTDCDFTPEQAGSNVTEGYTGTKATDATPITTPYYEAGLCPVNVHWHLGAEHFSAGEFDRTDAAAGPGDRRLAAEARLGFRCNHYDPDDSKFTEEYHWQHCVGMHVGETYEVHWPHSKIGKCGTPWQYQSPFYDGVFCRLGENHGSGTQTVADFVASVNHNVGVQSQVFTIVNDEHYYYPDLIKGMIVSGQYGSDIAKYTGSTTGTSRNNDICSRYAPITWQVDRKCHLISASTFDKMCADMKAQADDMSSDLHAHGSRELVADHLAADNHQRRL